MQTLFLKAFDKKYKCSDRKSGRGGSSAISLQKMQTNNRCHLLIEIERNTIFRKGNMSIFMNVLFLNELKKFIHRVELLLH